MIDISNKFFTKLSNEYYIFHYLHHKGQIIGFNNKEIHTDFFIMNAR